MSRAKVRTSVTKDAMGSTLAKSLPSGMAEAGVHVHMLQREFKQTAIDGAHFHIFMMPDGSFVRTEEDGRHQQKIEAHGDGFEWIGDGVHGHRIGELTTELDGWHTHQTQTDSTAFDGVHTHKLMLEDGTTIESLLPAQVHLLEGSPMQSGLEAPPASELAKTRGPMEAAAFLTENGDLEIQFGTETIRVMLSRRSLDDDFNPADFSVTGSKYHRAFELAPAQLTGKSREGKIELGKGTIEVGNLQPDQREFFLQLPPPLDGNLSMTKRDGIWMATLSTRLPDVLKSTGAPMPEPGCSALPASLEQDIPEPLRYWEKADQAKARAARDWLVETDYFTRDADVRAVGGALRLVHIERRYFSHVVEKAETDGWHNIVKTLLPNMPVASPFEEDDGVETAKSMDAATLMFADVTPSMISAADLVGLCQKHYLLTTTDSAEAREAFAKVGRPFKLYDPGAADHLFVASFPVNADKAAFVPVGKPFAGFADFDACVRAQMDDGKSEASAQKICGTLQEELEKDASTWAVKTNVQLAKARLIFKEDDEERIVYGVVAEPEETDTQGDTEDAETIRIAAHKFMEDFGNIGLQHQKFVTGKVKILESFVAPMDFILNGEKVKKGSWLLGVRVLDDQIWIAVKSGELTGFSFGGVAERVPIV